MSNIDISMAILPEHTMNTLYAICSMSYLGETLTMVAWLTMVNHGWTMVDSG